MSIATRVARPLIALAGLGFAPAAHAVIDLTRPPSLDLGSILVQLVAKDRLTEQDVGCWLSSFAPGRSEPGRYQARF